MYSVNMKQFRIRHLLIGIVLVSIAMGLISTGWDVAFWLGVLVLVICVGGYSSFLLMFVSDLIDDRRIDDRKLRSRFWNGVGLAIVLLTFLTAAILSLLFLFKSGIWLLERPAIPEMPQPVVEQKGIDVEGKEAPPPDIKVDADNDGIFEMGLSRDI